MIACPSLPPSLPEQLDVVPYPLSLSLKHGRYVMHSGLEVRTSDVMIPGVEPVPDYVFSHFLK